MNDMVGKPIHWAEHVFLIGPDPIDPDEPTSLWETILPWPVRLLLVLVAALIARQWSSTGLGEELAAALQYGGLVAVSLAASNWWILLAGNSVLALAWLLLGCTPRDPNSRLAKLTQIVVFLNRQVGHIELQAAWWTVALALKQDLRWQLPLLAAVLLLWEPVVNGIGSMRPFRDPARKEQRPHKIDGSLFWARRPVIYAATLLGQIAIALWAPRQMHKLLPIMLAVALPDAIRYLRHRWRTQATLKDDAVAKQRRIDIRTTQRLVGRHADVWFGPGLVTLGMLVAVLLSWQARRAWVRTAAEALGSAGVPREICDSTAEAPVELSLFLVADDHWHQLGGERFSGQRDFADALVPVARRPVELDILSVGSLLRFASVFHALAQQEQAAGRILHWAHLGDLADMGCCNEFERASQTLAERFLPEGFIGLAPGNHDKAFAGNFFWSPFWDRVCRSQRPGKVSACSGRLEKATSDRALTDLWRQAVEASGGRMQPVPGGELYSWLTSRGSALATVTPLGVVHHQGQARGLLAVFVDTADERGRDYGIAGEFGTLSNAQVDELLVLKDAVVKHAVEDDHKDVSYREAPLYLIFGHSPIGALTGKAKAHFDRLVNKLDDGKGPRVAAYLAAHTHIKGAAAECVAGRRLPEVIVGSTLDPPQEAAILRVGPDATGALSVRVRALSLVDAQSRSCGTEPTIAASRCTKLLAQWQRNRPCCADLFRRSDGSIGPDCQAFERTVSTRERLKLAARSAAPLDEAEILADQKRRARALFACLTAAPPKCAVAEDLMSLDDDAYTALQKRVAATPEGETALACLAWAASAMQAHKATGMEISDALRCAFDDPSMPGPREYVASMEVIPCR
ncbi:MAG TPA: hypothetical protein VJ801_16135 [Polyangia bacterium]|nr:hypothetical protein [Polyangia bacterium]